jgi:SMODS and SLOG-associating 2TM effector domain 1/Protein of unknown function (DUF4231)
MDAQLQALAESQGKWSRTADRLKSGFQGTRWATFGFSITGALLAAIASQVDDPLRGWLAATSAVLFAVVSFVTARRLGADQAMAWVRARAAAEALKREAYTYAAQAAPYDDEATRGALLRKAVQQIETGVDDLMGEQVQAPAGNTPVENLSPAAYLDQRVRQQIDRFFEPKAATYQKTARNLRRIEFALALVTACITALLASRNKNLIAGLNFDFVALTAVLTTVSGAIVSHIEASRYDFIVASYRAAARRLRDAWLNVPGDAVAPSPAWSAFVSECEAILSNENSSWVAKLGRPMPPAGRPL